MIAIAKGIVALLLLIGAALCLLSTLGLLRLPDVYNRSHAASKAATLGTMSVLFGVFIYYWAVDGVLSAKVLLGILFIFVTLPIGGHLVSRAAYYTGVPLWEGTVEDDLAIDDLKQAEARGEAGGS
ncbi:Na+/H+ antiporter subunit G [Ammoniphilus oxalaticus]|uniref:Na+/H+ antiporter subunit G n=1 Tax=Ammoniphilus oxalaticus TaxID=66863 RepID=A0A419SKM2_9BACL|nr:monovalent cation/H(+) antiporter subunit G [Ammoniphilus oxalaticus]RKD24499.1 Na+/H+ antiporter subunit G [Ammoniphilus oxalaticus]